MHKRFCISILITTAALGTDKLSVPQLIGLAHKKSHDLAEALRASLGDADIKKGTAVAAEGPEFIWAIESDARPVLYIDDQPAGAMNRAGKSDIWFYAGKFHTGTVHGFYYMVNGARTGGKYDVSAYSDEAYAKPGVPQGTLSEKLAHTSQIYDGMQSDYWIYVPAQYSPGAPAA